MAQHEMRAEKMWEGENQRDFWGVEIFHLTNCGRQPCKVSYVGHHGENTIYGGKRVRSTCTPFFCVAPIFGTATQPAFNSRQILLVEADFTAEAEYPDDLA